MEAFSREKHDIKKLLYIPYITKTCLYNFDPLKPYFYIVKLGFTGVYIIFLVSAQIGGSNEYPQFIFLSRNKNTTRVFYLKIFSFCS